MPGGSESISKKSASSAGLLMFRQIGADFKVLLVHPGGPFFARKEEGAWSIPKGEAAPEEDLLTRAKIEFEEEIGFAPNGIFLPLGSIKQKGGKTVYAWAVEGELPSDFCLVSNTCELEWPARSGRRQTFPEIDRAEFFDEATARHRINPAQVELIDRLATLLAID
jgi:predicted NUDIX family NTP pyrophosphohydrolase